MTSYQTYIQHLVEVPTFCKLQSSFSGSLQALHLRFFVERMVQLSDHHNNLVDRPHLPEHRLPQQDRFYRNPGRVEELDTALEAISQKLGV
jgi:hypothetical protein